MAARGYCASRSRRVACTSVAVCDMVPLLDANDAAPPRASRGEPNDSVLPEVDLDGKHIVLDSIIASELADLRGLGDGFEVRSAPSNLSADNDRACPTTPSPVLLELLGVLIGDNSPGPSLGTGDGAATSTCGMAVPKHNKRTKIGLA